MPSYRVSCRILRAVIKLREWLAYILLDLEIEGREYCSQLQHLIDLQKCDQPSMSIKNYFPLYWVSQ